MLYKAFGPYELETKKGVNGIALDIDKKGGAQKRFWEEMDKKEGNCGKSLREGRGVYVFAEKLKFNYTPWYVGQSKKGFAKEVFSNKNIKDYNDAYIHKFQKGSSAVIFLVVKMTRSEKLCVAKILQREADFVERLILGHAIHANRNLINVSGMRFLRNMEIRGILNTHEDDAKDFTAATKSLRRCLNIKGRVPCIQTESEEDQNQ